MKATVHPSPWSGDRNREREIKRDAVLRAAAQAFNENGFHATSLDDVARRLNVTKPTLYYYVKSKNEILFECVRIALERLKSAIDEAGASGGTALDKLILAMEKYVGIITTDFGMCLIRIGEDPLPPESRKKLRGLKAGVDRELRRLIGQGIAEGLLEPCDPKLAAFTLAGALSWIGRWYRPDGSLSPEDIAAQCIAVLTSGMVKRARPKSAKRI